MNATSKALSFWDEVLRLMDERGIEDLEILYGRFMVQGPERIGNAKWTFERFRRHVAHDVDSLDPRFIVPLNRTLDTTDREEAGLFLAWFGDVIGQS